jgi:N-acyl-D-aspartate/D-glutamate deacylase
MTSLSAAHVGIEGRGLILPGYAADLVLFNPDTITDNATIQQHDRLADGITGVWVNGERVWQNQQSTSARPGVFVARD